MKQQAERPKAAELRERGGYSVVDGSALAAMLPRWQGVTRPRPGPQAVLEAVVRLRGAALPFSALERDILSARVLEYAPEYLDRLCADGIITWQGCERIGERDGRVALYLRGDMPALGRIRVPEAGKPAAAIRDLLARQGGMLFAEITATLGGFPPDLLRALWRLVWNGEASCDTLAPLRSLRGIRGRRRAHRAGSRSRRVAAAGSDGRWSLIAGPDRGFAAPEARMAALARSLLDRYGVLTRELITAEDVPGGIGSLRPALERLVDAGELWRGEFIAGAGAEQYALPAACASLQPSQLDDDVELVVLAATDPANAYGTALRWPHTAAVLKPQRAAGARVILLGGELLAYLDRTGHSLLTFVDETDPRRGRKLARLAGVLARLARNGEALLIEQVNDTSPDTTALGGPLREAGFRASSRGLLCRPRRD